ncbi:hypothetical protein ACFL60_07080 [Candidatus Omnitrophota bacterium]
MAKCNFSIDFKGSAEELVNKAKKAIDDAGGSFSGDATKGSFSVPTPVGTIKGNYTISGQTAHFETTDKPWLVSCDTIEKKLREYLGQAASLSLED